MSVRRAAAARRQPVPDGRARAQRRRRGRHAPRRRRSVARPRRVPRRPAADHRAGRGGVRRGRVRRHGALDAELDRELAVAHAVAAAARGQPLARPPAAARRPSGRGRSARYAALRARAPRRADAADRARRRRRCGGARRRATRRCARCTTSSARSPRPPCGCSASTRSRCTRSPQRSRPELDELAAAAADHAATAARPSCRPRTSLLADILAEHHATWEVRLFAS